MSRYVWIPDHTCPTCGAETRGLHAATIHGEYKGYWCHRCGTLVEDGGPDEPRPISIHRPGLVDCVRELVRPREDRR